MMLLGLVLLTTQNKNVHFDENVDGPGEEIRDRMYDRGEDLDACFASSARIRLNEHQAFIRVMDIPAFNIGKCSSNPSACPLLFNATYMSL